MPSPDPAPPTIGPPTIGLNDFARRQTVASRFSHYAGSEADLLGLAAECLPRAKPGNRDGVLTVPVPIAGFYSGVVAVNDRMGLDAQWVRRADGEDPYIEITAPDAAKAAATAVTLVVYRRDLLLAGGRATTQAEWEIVSINARSDRAGGDEPPAPLSMARNQLERPGGSPAAYTASEYARAILYWSRRVHVGSDPDRKPLTGPEFPPLLGAVVKREHCPDWAEAVCKDWTFLPPADMPEPPRPITLALRHGRLIGGRVPDDGAEWARSILYWSRRPRRESDRPDDL